VISFLPPLTSSLPTQCICTRQIEMIDINDGTFRNKLNMKARIDGSRFPDIVHCEGPMITEINFSPRQGVISLGKPFELECGYERR
jgi:hypothetical protein